MQYNDKDMEALIDEVETNFSAHLAKSEQVEVETKEVEENQDLKKSEDTETVEVEAKADEDSQENADLAKNEDSETEDENTLDYDDEDFAEMNELYGSMTKSEQEAHYKAVKAAFLGSEDESQEDTQEEPVEMKKSEDSEDDKSEDDEMTLLKSELEASKKETEELKKSVGNLVSMLTKKVKDGAKAPQQKAITHIEYMAKSEDENKQETENDKDFSEMSREDVKPILMEKIRTADLTKSQRERINAFYLDNETNIDSIKDLL